LAGKEKASAEFTQEHSLIRSPQDYALFFETHAAGNGRKPNTLQ
jgi:hypothetical protein